MALAIDAYLKLIACRLSSKNFYGPIHISETT